MAEQKADISGIAFFKALGRAWKILLFGGVSFLLTVVSIFVGSRTTRDAFGVLTILSLILALYKVWEENQIEIFNLKKRPYDDAVMQEVQSLLSPLGEGERNLLKNLLLYGERTTEQLKADSGLADHDFHTTFDRVARLKIVQRDERQRTGRAGTDLFWKVNPNFQEALRDALFTSQEETAMDEKSSKDWWARIIGLGGLLVAIVGLCISYRSAREQTQMSNWQKSVQKESLTEKLQDNVCLIGDFDKNQLVFGNVPPRGGVRIEIVNIGQPKVYVKEVRLKIGEYSEEAYPGGHIKLPLVLESGMNAYFEIKAWDFKKHPLSWKSEEKEWEPYRITVVTTKDAYELEGHTNSFLVSAPASVDLWKELHP